MKKLIAMLLSISMLFSSNISYAELDIGHNCKEDFKLRFNNWYAGPCKNGKDTCIKNLIRYDGISDLVKFLNDIKKNATDEKVEYFWAPLLQKTAIIAFVIINLIALIKKAPEALIMLLLSLYTWISTKCKKSEEFKKELFGKGLLEIVREYIFGDKVVTVLKKEQKIKFAQNILDKLHEQIKNKKWENNDILLLTVDIDPKVMESYLKFDNVSFALNYKEPLKNYFKNIKSNSWFGGLWK